RATTAPARRGGPRRTSARRGAAPRARRSTRGRGREARSRGAKRPGARAGPLDRARDLSQVRGVERERGAADPAVYLFRTARTHDRARDAWPGERPRDRDGADVDAVLLRDRRKRVAQREVAPEVRLLEVGRAPAPVV